MTTRAERDGDSWVINGQKVWTSGAQYADFGYLLTRSDPLRRSHAGLTAFLVPMDAPGVDVRPLRQMSGGSSFNEVFLSDVRVLDAARVGDVGEGWRVAITTLGFERMSASVSAAGERARSCRSARAAGPTPRPEPTTPSSASTSPARGSTDGCTRTRRAERSPARLPAAVPGPEGSIGKLAATLQLRRIGDGVTGLLGPRLVADTGEWGTYAWSEFVNGTPGYRIAGGSDEIQRNILAERVLGLPRDPAPPR